MTPRRVLTAAVAVVAAFAVGVSCTRSDDGDSRKATTSTGRGGTPAPTIRPVGTPPAACTARPGPLPDPACTPGMTNPVVDADASTGYTHTICKTGWTDTVRPSSRRYTEPLKRWQIQGDPSGKLRAAVAHYLRVDPSKLRVGVYGPYAGQALAGYEEDHLIPLSAGGDPTSPLNLWPEQGATPNGKDRVEWAAHAAVCAQARRDPQAAMRLLTHAQALFATDWRQVGRILGVS